MNRKLIGSIIAIVSGLGLLAQYLLPIIVRRTDFTPASTWVPWFRSAGKTQLVYSYAADALGPVVTVVFAVIVGYVIGRRLDITREYRPFVGTLAVGSFLPVLVAWGLILWSSSSSSPFSLGSLLVYFGIFVRLVAEVMFVVTVGAFAGAAFARFRADDTSPKQPTTADTETSERPASGIDGDKPSDAQPSQSP